MAKSRFVRPDTQDLDARPAGMRRLYPTETGAGRLGPYAQPGDGTIRDDDVEYNTRCQQCGWPLSKPGSTCDLCTSDNYEGEIYEP